MVPNTKLRYFIVLVCGKNYCNLNKLHALHEAKFGGFTVLSF